MKSSDELVISGIDRFEKLLILVSFAQNGSDLRTEDLLAQDGANDDYSYSNEVS